MKNQKVNIEELNMELDSLLEESAESVEPVENDMSDPYYEDDEDDDYPYDEDDEDDDYDDYDSSYYDAVEREIYRSPQEEEEQLEAYYKYLEESNTPPYNEGDIVQMRDKLDQTEDELAVVLKVQMPPVYEDYLPTCFVYCKGRIIQGFIDRAKTVIGSEIIYNYSIPELDKKLDEYQKTIQ